MAQTSSTNIPRFDHIQTEEERWRRPCELTVRLFTLFRSDLSPVLRMQGQLSREIFGISACTSKVKKKNCGTNLKAVSGKFIRVLVGCLLRKLVFELRTPQQFQSIRILSWDQLFSHSLRLNSFRRVMFRSLYDFNSIFKNIQYTKHCWPFFQRSCYQGIHN